MSWIYSEPWVVRNEELIREIAPTMAPDRASVWNARMMSLAASGQLTRQLARHKILNELRAEVGQGQAPPPIPSGEEVGTLRASGLDLINAHPEHGDIAWMFMGYRMFDTVGMHLAGMLPFGQALDYPVALGFNTIAVGTMMWNDPNNPKRHATTMKPDTPGLYNAIADCATTAKNRGVRLFAYGSADADALGINEAAQHKHWLTLAEIVQGGFHGLSCANEWNNGNSSDVQRFPIPPNCPIWSRGSSGEMPPKPNGATVCETEIKRRGPGEEPFKMKADAASIAFFTSEPSGPKLGVGVLSAEAIFAAENNDGGRRSNDPTVFQVMAGAAALTRRDGSHGYFFGCEDSARGTTPGPKQDACAKAAIVAMRTGFSR